MCRFASRCENFYPDPDDKSNCLLLCQKNPLALAIALMPDRYVEKDRPVDPDRKILKLSDEDVSSQDRRERVQEEYDEMVTATQDLDNEVVEFEFDPEQDLIDKFKKNKSANIPNLIKRVTETRSSTKMDDDVEQAIIDNVTDDGTNQQKLHPLDEINFEPVERIAVADQPDTPDNPEVYVKTRERGRPKMTDEEKETSRIKREEEKEAEKDRKQEEAIEARRRMKERVAKKKKKKKSKK